MTEREIFETQGASSAGVVDTIRSGYTGDFLVPSGAGEWMPQFLRPTPTWDAAALYGAESTPGTGVKSISERRWGGLHSTAIEPLGEGASGPAAAEIAPFQILSIGIMIFYCWMIYAFRSEVVASLANVVRLGGSDDAGHTHRRGYDHFSPTAASLGAVALGAAAGKIAAQMLYGAGGEVTEGLWRVAGAEAQVFGVSTGAAAEWIPALVAVVVVVVAVCVVALGIGIVHAAGALTLSGGLAEALTRRKWNSMSVAAVVLIPLAVIFSGTVEGHDKVILWGAAGVIAVIVVLFVVHTARLFRKEKVSLLVWFLYLCAVELFPISLVVLLAVKNV